MSWKLQNLASGTGWVKLGLLMLAGLIVANAGRGQDSFYAPQPLSGDYGSVANDNSGFKADPSAPNIAGFPPNAPLWYQWTASSDGEVELGERLEIQSTGIDPTAIRTAESIGVIRTLLVNMGSDRDKWTNENRSRTASRWRSGRASSPTSIAAPPSRRP